MKLRSKIIYIIITFFLTGCATLTPFPKTSDEVYLGSSVSDDPYTKTIYFTSPEVCSGGVDVIKLASAKTCDIQIPYYSLMAMDYSDKWMFYESARDINGNVLDLKVLDREVLSANLIRECIVIHLNREYLDQAINHGMDIRLEGERGNSQIFLPAFFIEGFLRKVDGK